MAINHNKFVPRPGIVNKEGYLPDPTELVCIEVPKVFDQVLIKRCLVYEAGPDTESTDEELRSDALISPRRFLGCRDFNIKLTSVDKTPLKKDSNFKRVVIDFVIGFYMDYIDGSGSHQSELFEVNRTEFINRMYYPESASQASSSFLSPHQEFDILPDIIKLELVAECLDGKITTNCHNQDVIDITLGFHLLVKCELVVQLLIPTYNFCPAPSILEEEVEEDPRERFERQPVPKFYPDQNLTPLFPDCDTCENFDKKE